MGGTTYTMDDLLAALPTPSAVALEVVAACSDDSTRLDELVVLLSGDPALAARILAEANTARFGTPRKVTTLDRAAMLLGLRSLRSTALTFVVLEWLPREGAPGGLDLRRFWARSLATAVAARIVSQALRRPDADQAFLGGLLSDVGRLGLALSQPEIYATLHDVGGPFPPEAAERRAFGLDSPEFGSRMLAAWSLPDVYVWAPLSAAGRVPSSPTPVPIVRMGPVLQAARAIASAVTSGSGAGLGDVYQHAWQRLGLSQAEVDAQLALLAAEVDAAARRLDLVLPPFEADLLRLAAERAQERIRSVSAPDAPAPS